MNLLNPHRSQKRNQKSLHSVKDMKEPIHRHSSQEEGPEVNHKPPSLVEHVIEHTSSLPEPVLRYYRAMGPEAFLELLGYEITVTLSVDQFRITHESLKDRPWKDPDLRSFFRKYGFETYASAVANSIWVSVR